MGKYFKMYVNSSVYFKSKMAAISCSMDGPLQSFSFSHRSEIKVYQNRMTEFNIGSYSEYDEIVDLEN